MVVNWMKERMGNLVCRWMISVLIVCVAAFGMSRPAMAADLSIQQPVVAYNIDFGMDLARIEQTIEHYGEEIREVVEQALLNNENHPESKDTAKNSYQRVSVMNDLLPEKRNSAFSKDDLTNLRKTKHPRELLK